MSLYTETTADGTVVGSKDYGAKELAGHLRVYAECEEDADLRGYLLWAAEKLEACELHHQGKENA